MSMIKNVQNNGNSFIEAPESKLWRRTFDNYMKSSKTPEESAEGADRAVALYQERFESK